MFCVCACRSQKLADTSLLFLFNVRTRLMLGVFAPDGPAGMEIEPSAFGGGSRFPVQVRFQSVHPSGQVLSVPETALGDVLRYRNASTRFDLLLRGRAVDKIVGIFSQRGVSVGGLGPAASLSSPGGQESMGGHAGSPYAGAEAFQFGSHPSPVGYSDPQQQPQQPPLPPQPPPQQPPLPPAQQTQQRQQPPLPPQPPPPLPPLPPDLGSGSPKQRETHAASVGRQQQPHPLPPKQMPPLPPLSAADAEAIAAETAAAAVDVSAAEDEGAASGGAAPLEAVLGSLSLSSGAGAAGGSAPPP